MMQSQAVRDDKGDAGVSGAAVWLSLAAAPTCLAMAVLNGFGGEPDLLCATMQGTSPLSGMTAMYLLMAAFHAGPWLRLIAARSRRFRASLRGSG